MLINISPCLRLQYTTQTLAPTLSYLCMYYAVPSDPRCLFIPLPALRRSFVYITSYLCLHPSIRLPTSLYILVHTMPLLWLHYSFADSPLYRCRRHAISLRTRCPARASAALYLCLPCIVSLATLLHPAVALLTLCQAIANTMLYLCLSYIVYRIFVAHLPCPFVLYLLQCSLEVIGPGRMFWDMSTESLSHATACGILL